MRFLSYGLLAAAGLLPKRGRAGQTGEKERLTPFVFAQIKYRGGDWNPHPLAVIPLMEELMQRTSVEAAASRREVNLMDLNLFSYPFLYMAGK